MDHIFYTAEEETIRRTGLHTSLARAIFFLMTAFLLCQTSCTKGTYFGKEQGLENSQAILQDIIISENNTKIAILANKPLKYTLYNIAEPPRAVVDLYADVLSPFKPPVKIDTSLVSQIDIIKKETDGRIFTRVIFKLKRNVAFSAKTDPSSINAILLTVTPPQESIQAGVETKPDGAVPKAEARHGHQPDEKTDTTDRVERYNTTTPTNFKHSSASDSTASSTGSPLPETGMPKPAVFPEADKISRDTDEKQGQSTTKNTVYGITFIQDGIGIALIGLDDDNVKFFKLTRPQRLVIDLFGVKNSLERNLFPVNSFGIKSIRIGTYPYKVRIVLDSSEKVFPVCRIKTDNRGVQVLFNNNP